MKNRLKWLGLFLRNKHGRWFNLTPSTQVWQKFDAKTGKWQNQNTRPKTFKL